MLNLTLTITAAPELLAAISNFSNTLTATKVASIQAQPAIPNQQISQAQVPSNVTNLYNQPSNIPIFPAQTPGQAASQSIPAQGATVPTTAQTYTMEQLAVAATQIVDVGRRTELINLLNSFGVQALTALPKDQYGTFATQLRALGAKI